MTWSWRFGALNGRITSYVPGWPLWRDFAFPGTPFLMIADAAPLTTQLPWVRTRTTSFGARVRLVSRTSASSVLPKGPSVEAGKSLLFGMPAPQVLVATPSTPN